MLKPVPSQWPTREGEVRIAIVTVGPSYDDVGSVKLMAPDGGEGKVFDMMLRAANIDREELLITSLFEYQAPADDYRAWLKDPSKITPALERLTNDLDFFNPHVIIAMGTEALGPFGLQGSIEGFRGTLNKSRGLLEGRKVAPTYHPTTIMRDWRRLPVAAGDMIRAYTSAVETGFDLVLPAVELWIEPELADIEDWYARTRDTADLIALDIETGWGMMTNFGWGISPTTAFNIPLIDLRKANKSYWKSVEDERAAHKWIATICALPQPKLLQNGAYDAMWLWKKYGIEIKNYREDTRALHHALFPELPKSLEFMNATYTDIGPYKMMGGRFQKDEEKKDG